MPNISQYKPLPDKNQINSIDDVEQIAKTISFDDASEEKDSKSYQFICGNYHANLIINSSTKSSAIFFFHNILLHRSGNAPSVIYSFSKYKEYHIAGNRHRATGKSMTCRSDAYFIHDDELDKAKYLSIVL